MRRARPRVRPPAGPRTATGSCSTTSTTSGASAADGAGAKNITAGYGRQHDLRLRYIRTEAENPRERGSTARSR